MTQQADTTSPIDPVTLRGVFGANLRQLASRYPSVAGLCRELGINRTQFNRYLAAESFPRPDVLHRICTFFDVDARVLLQPVAEIEDTSTDFFRHPAIADYLGQSVETVSEDDFPSGFYRYSRAGFVNDAQFVMGLYYVFRQDGRAFVRGYEIKEAMRDQGLSTHPFNREFRGVIIKQEQGVVLLLARRGATTCSYSFLSKVPSFHQNYWEGYATRTVAESLTDRRVTRLVCERLLGTEPTVMEARRSIGFYKSEDLPGYHARLLRIGQEFR